MDYNLQNAIENSQYYVNKLLTQLTEFRDDIPYCVGGDILSAYRNVTDLAESETISIQSELQRLQDELQAFEDETAQLGL